MPIGTWEVLIGTSRVPIETYSVDWYIIPVIAVLPSFVTLTHFCSDHVPIKAFAQSNSLEFTMIVKLGAFSHASLWETVTSWEGALKKEIWVLF